MIGARFEPFKLLRFDYVPGKTKATLLGTVYPVCKPGRRERRAVWYIRFVVMTGSVDK